MRAIFALFALVAGCATHHRPIEDRIERDGSLPVDVIDAAPEGVPVTATAHVRDGHVASTVTVTVGAASPVYASGTTWELQQAAALSAAYRQQWAADNNAAPGVRPQAVYVSPGTVTTASGSVTCPERFEDIDTLEERVVCLEADVDYIISSVGVK